MKINNNMSVLVLFGSREINADFCNEMKSLTIIYEVKKVKFKLDPVCNQSLSWFQQHDYMTRTAPHIISLENYMKRSSIAYIKCCSKICDLCESKLSQPC